jgi:putative transposase
MDWRIREGRRKAFNTPGHAHELTFSCYERFPFLKAERTAFGWPTPLVKLVCNTPLRFGRTSSCRSKFTSLSSRGDKITRRRGTRTERVFWQTGGGYDRNITCGKTLLQMIEYLHMNPVRRELVEQARDWKWSIAMAFEGEQSPIAVDPIPWDWLADA